MYRILVADDEGIVIDSMKFIIDKEFGDICQAEYAKSGRSVIEMAERFRPDIAVMDIHMPGINGIDAMKEIRKYCPDTVFIVMSAYDKFDYAQEAIKLGVIEYVNKPMNKVKIIDTLKRAMVMIDDQRRKHSEDLLVKEKLETVEPIIENGFIYNILFKEQFDEDLNNFQTLLDIRTDYGYMMALVCGDSQEGNHMTNAVGSSVRISLKYTEIRDAVKDYFDCKIGAVMANKIAILVPYDKPVMEYNERIELIDRARELVRYLSKKEDISCRLGIGKVKDLKNLGESYSEALNSLIASTGSAAHGDDIGSGCDYEADYPVDMEKGLFDSIEKGDLNSALSFAGRFMNWMVDNADGNFDGVRLKTLECALWAERMAFLSGGTVYRFHSRDSYLSEIMRAGNAEELMAWFGDKLTTVIHNIKNNKEEKSTGVIKNAEKYIEENFSGEVSLDDVSRQVGISPYYFSKIFKEEKGIGFIEYVTNMRIEKAKELLGNSDLSMREICNMCGYSDPNYFSRTFKKNVGVTPTEFKDGKL